MAATVGYYWTPSGDDRGESLALLADTGANAVFLPRHALHQALVAELRRRGIQIYVDWSVFAGEELRRSYPDSAPVEASGDVFERDGWYVPVCPNHPNVRKGHLEDMRTLLDQWGSEIDGLWLDFIRYPVRWEGENPRLPQACFCKHCLNAFLRQDRTEYTLDEIRSQARTILHERWDEWVDWKCERIAQFVEAVRAELVGRGLSIALGMFSLPWRRSDFEGAIRTVAGQDLKRLAASIDVFSPMVYHRLCGRPVAWIREVVREAQDWTQRPVLPIVQAFDRPDPMPAPELAKALGTALDTAPYGVMIFTLDPVLASRDKSASVRERLGVAG